MNHMERVVAAMQHKETDYTPVYPIISGASRQLNHSSYRDWSTNADICAEALLMAQKELDLDCIVTLIDLSVECDGWGQPLIFPEDEAARPDYSKCIIETSQDYGQIQKADYRLSKRMMMHIDVCKQLVEKAKGEFPVVAFVFGPLGVLSMLRNQQELYMDLYDAPEDVKSAATQINETLKEYCRALMATGVTGIMLDTLFASGSIMSKDMWNETEGPLVEELSNVIREAGGLVMIHNCGQKVYFDVQIQRMKPSAISFLYAPDDCKDLKECKEKYGDQVMLSGCVTPATAAIGTDDEWETECRQNMADLMAGGGYMLATGCEYPANTSLERAKIMVEIAKQGR